jgi:hypothetical protein
MSLRSRQGENHQKEIDALNKLLENERLEVAKYKAKWCDEVSKRHMEMRNKIYGGGQS